MTRSGEEGLMNGNKTLTKAEIVDNIYEKTKRNRAEVKSQVESLLEIMKQAIKKDHSLLVSGFGKFEAYDKKARKGRNPQTAETIVLPPRKVVVFRLSRKFRAELNPQQ
jgi:integration host factor subunit alpha